MLTYMLDTNICIYVMKNYPPNLREKFNTLAEQLCIAPPTLLRVPRQQVVFLCYARKPFFLTIIATRRLGLGACFVPDLAKTTDLNGCSTRFRFLLPKWFGIKSSSGASLRQRSYASTSKYAELYGLVRTAHF